MLFIPFIYNIPKSKSIETGNRYIVVRSEGGECLLGDRIPLKGNETIPRLSSGDGTTL